MSIRKTIIIAIVLVFVLIALLMSAKEFWNYTSRVDQECSRLIVKTQETFESVLNNTLILLSLTAKTIAEDPQTARFFAERNRGALIGLYRDYFSRLKNDFNIELFGFHTPPATSFIRFHSLKRHGDDLSAFRKTIVESNRTKQPSVGLEVSLRGLETRVVYPVKHMGRHVGTVEFSGFTRKMLENLQDIFRIDFAVGIDRKAFEQARRVEMKENDVAVGDIIYYTYSSDAAHSLAKMYTPGKKSYTIGKDLYFAGTFPLKDFSGSLIGNILVIQNQKAMRADMLINMVITIIVSGGIMAITIAVLLLLTNRTLRPLGEMVGVMDHAAKGDLTISLSERDTGNEISAIENKLSVLIIKIGNAVRQIHGTTSEVARSSEEMSNMALEFSESAHNQAASVEEVTASIEEISAGIENVAGGSLEQYERLTSFIEQMRVFSESINETSDVLEKTVTRTNEITDIVMHGEKSLSVMGESMSMVTSSLKEMTALVEIINDVSDQINLLSLNAAIEAARAGEFGQGFAVVADEISKLADKTALSIRKISGFIKSNNDEIVRGKETITETISTIRSIIGGVNDIGMMMSQLSNFMKNQLESNGLINNYTLEMLDRSSEMRSATKEQKTAMSEIVESISSINDLTQMNASSAEKMSETSKSLAVLAENLSSAVHYFKV